MRTRITNTVTRKSNNVRKAKQVTKTRLAITFEEMRYSIQRPLTKQMLVIGIPKLKARNKRKVDRGKQKQNKCLMTKKV
jgi:hypothetical protein